MGSSGKVKISVQHLAKTFISKSKTQNEVNEVVRDLSFDVYENEFVVLFGPGQCGKSTILNMIAGLESKTAGSVKINGTEVDGPQSKCGMVYQTTELFPWMRVMDNVMFGPKMRNVPKKTRTELAQKYIDLVGLKGFEKSYPIQLSGGMQQRVGIARAYCNQPEVILMDEPFGHLDAQTRYIMEEDIEKICNSDQRTVIFVTNNVEEAIYLADRILVLNNSPTSVYREYSVDIPRPREYTGREFLKLRDDITNQIESMQEGSHGDKS